MNTIFGTKNANLALQNNLSKHHFFQYEKIKINKKNLGKILLIDIFDIFYVDYKIK